MTHPNRSSAEIPSILFDGYAVMQALSPTARTRTNDQNVADVLDAVVRLMRAENTHPHLVLRYELALHNLIEARRKAQEHPHV